MIELDLENIVDRTCGVYVAKSVGTVTIGHRDHSESPMDKGATLLEEIVTEARGK